MIKEKNEEKKDVSGLNKLMQHPGWISIILIITTIITLFLWMLIDEEGFVFKINKFLNYLWQIVWGILTLAIAITGIRVMLGYPPKWWPKKH